MDIPKIIRLFQAVAQTPEIIELKEQVLGTFSSYTDILEKYNATMNKNVTLEKKIAEYEYWTNESENYELFKSSAGAIFYRHKKDQHLICPLCYDLKKGLIHLQPPTDFGGAVLLCNNCKSKFRAPDQ